MYGVVPGGSTVKNLPANTGDTVRQPGERNGTGNTPVFLLGKSQGHEPGGQQFMGSQKT